MSTLTRYRIPAALALALCLAAPAQAKAPGKSDPDKLVTKVGKAVSGRDWNALPDLCRQGLEITQRGSEWDQRWGEDLGVDMRLLWEQTLRETTLTAWEYGERKRDRDVQEVALELADLYLQRWPEHTNSYEMVFQKAQIAWTVREYRTAAETYEQLYKLNPRTGRRRLEASAGWIGSLWIDASDDWEFFDGQAAQARTERLDHTDMIARHQPIELRESEQELIEALDAFVSAAPDHAKAPDVLYRTVYMHHTRYQAKEGVARCIAFLQGFSDHDHAPWVASMLLDLATWSERTTECQLRVQAMGLRWEELEQQAHGVSGDPPAPFEPERLELFPRDLD
jgi:hypothetical protein